MRGFVPRVFSHVQVVTPTVADQRVRRVDNGLVVAVFDIAYDRLPIDRDQQGRPVPVDDFRRRVIEFFSGKRFGFRGLPGRLQSIQRKTEVRGESGERHCVAEPLLHIGFHREAGLGYFQADGMGGSAEAVDLDFGFKPPRAEDGLGPFLVPVGQGGTEADERFIHLLHLWLVDRHGRAVVEGNGPRPLAILRHRGRQAEQHQCHE